MKCQKQQCQCFPFCLVKKVAENCVIHQKYILIPEVQENNLEDHEIREHIIEDFC